METDERSIASREVWEDAAAGWVRHAAAMRSWAGPVSHWLVDAIAPHPGQRVLELAAGVGETGFMAAERLLPGGTLICTDQAEAMVEGARARAAELGLANVEFRVMGAEWIDLAVASVDAIICRWGFMLMDDCAAALRESRRVLRPEGRLALAVWDSIAHNPWSQIPGDVLRSRGLARPSDPDAPGPFALGDQVRLARLLEDTGFQDVVVQALDLTMREESFEAYWNTRLDISPTFHEAVMGLPEADMAELREELRSATAPYARPDGSLEIPARTLVASALA
ncbi:MAG: class I SAM-dependent methyltransferase [Solirubrobacteraceae bacterium]